MKKILKSFLILFIIVLTTLTTLGYINYKEAVGKISVEDKVAQIRSQSDYVSIDQVSDYLLEATVSVEDKRFYDHGGVDIIAYGRIAYVLITTGELSGGGSTITQQLAKNMYFGFHPSLIRKFSEFFVTFELENKYSKDELLELYINIINYGDNHMGIQQASVGYFDKQPLDLTFNEATLVAGIPQSPANYQLSDHKENALKRQEDVIQTLIDHDIYDEETILELMKE